MSYNIRRTIFMSLLIACLGLMSCHEVDESECGCSAPVPQLSQSQEKLAISGRWQPSANAEAIGQSVNVPITEAGAWQGQSSCSGTFTEGAQRVREWLFAHWPQVSDVQGYSCRAINGNPNVTSIHAVGRALDIFIPLDQGEADNDLGDPIGNYLMEHAEEIGIQRVIWDRTIWTAGRSSYEYTGAHPHHDHLHIELSVPAGNQETPFFMQGLPAPTQSPCGPALPVEGGIIDSDSPCLTLYGPARFWRSVGGEGYGDSLYWTNAFQNERGSNWARWRFSVSQTGRYALSIHSVPEYSVYPQVRYEITSADGVNQHIINPAGQMGWVPLAEARFEAGDQEFFVDVFDHYSTEIGAEQHIIVDALKVTALTAPIEPPPAGTEPPPAGTEPPPAGTEPPSAGTEPPPAGTEPSPSSPMAGSENPNAGTEASTAGTSSGRPIPSMDPQVLPEEAGTELPWEMQTTAKSGGASGCQQETNKDLSKTLLIFLMIFCSMIRGSQRRIISSSQD